MYNGVSDAVNLLSSANNLHYQIWMFYIVGATGILGFRFSDTYISLENRYRLMIMIGFAAFSISNAIALYQNLIHLDSILSFLREYDFPEKDSGLSIVFDKYNDKPTLIILGFHTISTLLLVLILYQPSRNRQKHIVNQ